jgi:molybdate/tungstate transport system ATP-binding protein
VALGRALSARPALLCLDEPLSALDHDTRAEMCDLLERLKRESGVTFLHITHDRSEAERLADVLFEVADGQVQARVSEPLISRPA